MKRKKLRDRQLPRYTHGEEIMNMVTHITGGGIGIIGLALCCIKAWSSGALAVVCAMIYGISMVMVYTISSIYHGLRPGVGKKVLQIIDHCTIYLLIAGTYTPIVLCAIAPVYPVIGWGLFAAQWGLAALAITLTAIDLEKYKAFSMVCYIAMGWGIIFFLPQTLSVLTTAGFWVLFAGGVAYTVGAVLFGLGKKLRWMHSVFHIFVILGSVLQLLCILFFVY